jgi:hypothetical protein
VRGEIALRRLEHLPAEAAALVFRREIEFENLAAIAERGHAIAAIAGVTRHLVGEIEHNEAGAAGNGPPPPVGAAPHDHPLEFPSRDHAAIGVPPCRIVHARDLGLVAVRMDMTVSTIVAKLRPRRPGPQGLDNARPKHFCAAAAKPGNPRRAILLSDFGRMDAIPILRVRREKSGCHCGA